uniref:Uncharacterized protein n=1 Tax=Arundo donax TaxID=35708 RepID=A0A0A8Y9F6_ARUDO
MEQLGTIPICSRPHIKQTRTSGNSIFSYRDSTKRPYQHADFSRTSIWLRQLRRRLWRHFVQTKQPSFLSLHLLVAEDLCS